VSNALAIPTQQRALHQLLAAGADQSDLRSRRAAG